MVTIDEIKERGQLSAKEHIEEERGNYPYVGYVLRRISPYLTKFFVEHNISANTVSTLSILLGIAANITFIFGDYYLMLLGVIIYQFWNICDLSDGEIARVTGIKTGGGKYIETINDPITECGFISCIGISLYKMFGDNSFIFWGLFFAICYALLSSFARTKDMIAERLQIKERKSEGPKKMLPAKKLYKKMRLLFVTINGYIVLTIIVIFQLLLIRESYATLLGIKLNFLSTYFFLYGLLWIIRMTVSVVTNYKYLIKHEKFKIAEYP